MKPYLVVILLVVGLYSIFQFSNPHLIGDDDVYWHIGYAANLLESQNWSREFFSNPPYAGVLFHILLTPFTLFSNLFIGQKIADLAFVAIVTFLTLKLLKTWKVRYAEFWTVIIFTCSVNFGFRLLLVRTYLLSLVLLLLATYLITKNNKKGLFITSVLYGLSYSIPFVIVLAVFYTLTKSWLEKFEIKHFVWILISILGFGLGMVLHPAFPDNAILLFQKVWPSLVTVPIAELDRGAEIMPMSIYQWLSQEGLVLFIWFFSSGIFFYSFNTQEERVAKTYLWAVSLFWFVLSVLYQRFLEYWPLFAILCSAYILKPYLEQITYKKLIELWQEFWQIKFATVFLSSFVIILLVMNVTQIYKFAKNSPSLKPYQQAGEWMRENLEPGSLVVNLNWAQFPKLYFYNSDVDYLVKFDPASLYTEDRNKYWQWRKLSGEDLSKWDSIETIHDMIANQFNADYLFIKKDYHPKLKSYFEQYAESGALFEIAYEDMDIIIYRIVK